MDFIRYKILFIPLLMILGLLAADRLFNNPDIVKYTVRWTNFERENYQFKEMLFRQLLGEASDREKEGLKLGLLFGTSRIMEFDNTEIDRLTGQHYTYNFSAPAATPSYYFYWLERIQEAGLLDQVDFVFLEFDPTILNRTNTKVSLAYSYDPEFVLENLELDDSRPLNIWDAEGAGFNVDEAETFFVKQYISLSKYPINPANILENQKTTLVPTGSGDLKALHKWEIKQELIRESRETLRKHRGGRPTYAQPDPDPQDLASHERITSRMHIQYLVLAPSQMIFFKRTLRLLASQRKEVILYWPPSTPGLRQAMQEYDLFDRHRAELISLTQSLEEEYPGARFTILDPMEIEGFPCLDLVDSFHLKSMCFPAVARQVVQILEKR